MSRGHVSGWLVGRLLPARGVDVRTGCVARVTRGAAAGLGRRQRDLPRCRLARHRVVSTRLLAELGLSDENGVPVRATLQHVDRDEAYAVGDCARFLPGPLPRIGVHGVRQGPVLKRILLARLRGECLPVYQPQRRALSILDLGDGVGLAVRGRWWGTVALSDPANVSRQILRPSVTQPPQSVPCAGIDCLMAPFGTHREAPDGKICCVGIRRWLTATVPEWPSGRA